MGQADKSKRTAAKKKRTKKWDVERFAKTLQAVIEERKGMNIYHVISREGDRWGILREGRTRMHKIYSDKKLAVDHAKRLAEKNSKWKVVVHKEDASIDQYIQPESLI